MCFKIQNTWLRLFIWALSRAQPKTENDSNGGKRAPLLSQKSKSFFFIGYNKTIGVRSGPGFLKTIKKSKSWVTHYKQLQTL